MNERLNSGCQITQCRSLPDAMQSGEGGGGLDATRPADPRVPEAVKKRVHCGAGPRATQYLLLAAKTGAVMRGSLVVNCNDVRLAAFPVLRHRMFTNFAADSAGSDVDDIIAKVLKEVHEPGEKDCQK